MKVCVDVQPAVAQRAGIGQYTRLLAQHLGAGAGHDTLGLFWFDFRRNGLPFRVPGATARPVRWCPGRLAQAAWKRLSWPPFDWFAGAADVYHFPNFVLPPLRRGKSVVTIHDTSFLRFPEFAEPRNLRYLTTRIRETAARADAVITDSRFSAGEIRERLPVRPERLFSIHLGVSPAFRPEPAPTVDETLRALRLTRPYLLTVGTLEPRKNIPFLIEVFERMTGFDGTWVLAGMPGWKYEPILERIRRSPCSGRIRRLDYVADAQLPALYAGAELFLFASVYEGFGLPPLEAMACGTPVIASRRGAMPEVLGPAAVLLDAFDADLWAERAGRLLADPAERAERIERGRRRAAQYTWRETACRTWEVYREVAR